MKYIIKKGKHYASFTWNRLWFISKRKIDKTVIFDKGCLTPATPSGMNKLDGISSILIHRNSGRLVWIANEDKIDVYGYVYLRGVRKQKFIAKLEVGREYNYTIEAIQGLWKFSIGAKDLYMDGKLGWFKFKCFVYFGGKATAPCDIKINIK
jgi:hypothetical protein